MNYICITYDEPGALTAEAIAMSAFGAHVNITMSRKKGFPDGDS